MCTHGHDGGATRCAASGRSATLPLQRARRPRYEISPPVTRIGQSLPVLSRAPTRCYGIVHIIDHFVPDEVFAEVRYWAIMRSSFELLDATG